MTQEHEDELTRQERIDAVIKTLEGMQWEAGTYRVHAMRTGNENDARYLDRIYEGCRNMIAILKGEPLPYPPKPLEP